MKSMKTDNEVFISHSGQRRQLQAPATVAPATSTPTTEELERRLWSSKGSEAAASGTDGRGEANGRRALFSQS